MNRELCLGSWLQIKQHKAISKKPRYQPENWVVLCVHCEGEGELATSSALLEWYPNDIAAVSHAPMKVVQLEDVGYVIPSIDDGRAFSIGFGDAARRAPLELAALTETDRDNWLEMLQLTLRQHNCLQQRSNEYATFASVARRPVPSSVDALLAMEDSVHTPQAIAPAAPSAITNTTTQSYTGPAPVVVVDEIYERISVETPTSNAAGRSLAEPPSELLADLSVSSSADRPRSRVPPPVSPKPSGLKLIPPTSNPSGSGPFDDYSVVRKASPLPPAQPHGQTASTSSLPPPESPRPTSDRSSIGRGPPALPPRPGSTASSSASANGEHSASNRSSAASVKNMPSAAPPPLESAIRQGDIREQIYDDLTDKYDVLPPSQSTSRPPALERNTDSTMSTTENCPPFPVEPPQNDANNNESKSSLLSEDSEQLPCTCEADVSNGNNEYANVPSPPVSPLTTTTDTPTSPVIRVHEPSGAADSPDDVGSRYASLPDRPKTVLFAGRRSPSRSLVGANNWPGPSDAVECTCNQQQPDGTGYVNQAAVDSHQVYDVIVQHTPSCAKSASASARNGTSSSSFLFDLPQQQQHGGLTRTVSGCSTGSQSAAPPVSPHSDPGSRGARSLRETQAVQLGREIRQDRLEVQLPLEAAVKGLAVVEIPDRGLWVAGWSQEKKHYAAIQRRLHVGDQIVAVNGRACNQMKHYEPACYHVTPGDPIVLHVKRAPLALVFTLRRPVQISTPDDAETSPLGIVCDRLKNFVVSIERYSPAAAAGLTVDCTSFADARQRSVYCITEVNGRPVSAFYKRGEANERLSARGRDVNVVVQPYDLIQALKRELKTRKDHKLFTLE